MNYLVILLFLSMLFIESTYSQIGVCEPEDSTCYCTETKLLAWFKTIEVSKKNTGSGICDPVSGWKDFSMCDRELLGVPEDLCVTKDTFEKDIYSINYNACIDLISSQNIEN